MHLNKKFSLNHSFCKTAPEFRHAISDSVKLINQEDWEQVNRGMLYLSIPYLEALEQTMETEMEFRYVIFYCENYQPVGIAYFQMVDLIDNGSKYRDAVKRLGKGIGSYIVNEMKVRTIVNGNVFQCGRFGYQFVDDLPHEAALAAVEDCMNRFRKAKEHRGKASIVLFKEFNPSEFEIADCLLDRRYHMFHMDVNMVMDIDTAWKNLEGYKEAITSKSRTRLNSILKKSDSVEIREMGIDEIQAYSGRINELFQQVLEKSSFKFGELKSQIYVAWKKALDKKLMFKGFFEGQTLIGFNSAFIHDDYLDAHYVGIDYSRNESLALYQRMLVELLADSIDLGKKQLIMGRTAEQAKSSLGAYPVEMRLYTKHRNALANKLIAPVIASVKPSEFETRNPFKKA